MTGVLGRLRAWLGSVFGGAGDADERDAEAGNEAPTAGGGPVVHRDSRPLETPSGMSKDDLAPETVSPQSEGAGDATRGGERADAPTDSTAGTPDLTEEPPGATGDDGDDAGDAPAFKCSVCGTGVADEDGECPLCHSTQVVPVDAEGDAPTTVHGRTETAAGVDDDAVDRLGDLRREREE